MNCAHLGPAPPKEAADTPAFTVRSWSVISDLNGLGEACLTFVGHAAGYNVEVVLLVATHPGTGNVIRCVAIHHTGEHEKIPTAWIPGIVADLARTKTLEVFGPPA